MRTFKVAIVGSPGVGKTTFALRSPSLSGREYGKSVGVLVARAKIPTTNGDATLMLWDIDGSVDAEQRWVFCRDASGFVVVSDVTRPETLTAATALLSEIAQRVPNHRSVLMLNKTDLMTTPNFESGEIRNVSSPQIVLKPASAECGEGCEEILSHLATALISAREGGK